MTVEQIEVAITRVLLGFLALTTVRCQVFFEVLPEIRVAYSHLKIVSHRENGIKNGRENFRVQ